MIIDEAYTFDDVLLQPAHSLFGPAEASVDTYITKIITPNGIELFFLQEIRIFKRPKSYLYVQILQDKNQKSI